MSPITLAAVRYGIPAALFIAGMVVWGIGSVAAGAMFISAATAVLLLNVLFRIGIEGDKARDREEEARRYFDEHGHWPGE
jgi:thiamine transporter ThiT